MLFLVVYSGSYGGDGFVGKIRRAYHWGGSYVVEAHLKSFLFVHLESVGVNVSVYRVISSSRALLLSDSEYVTAGRPQVFHCFNYLFVGFANANHHAAFANHTFVGNMFEYF